MNICIKSSVSNCLERHPKLKQWLWFGMLWLGGLTAAMILALPFKLLVKLMS